MSKKQKFYSILKDLFVGAKLEGEGGLVNLMNIKTTYFEKIRENIQKEIDEKFPDETALFRVIDLSESFGFCFKHGMTSLLKLKCPVLERQSTGHWEPEGIRKVFF